MSTTGKLDMARALLEDCKGLLVNYEGTLERGTDEHNKVTYLLARLDTATSENSGHAASARYNGHANYETWTVALIIDNESNAAIEDAIRASLQDEHGDALKEHVETVWLTDPNTDEEYGAGNSMVTQLLGAAMDEVDWRELRDAYAEQASDYGMAPDEDADAVTDVNLWVDADGAVYVQHEDEGHVWRVSPRAGMFRADALAVQTDGVPLDTDAERVDDTRGMLVAYLNDSGDVQRIHELQDAPQVVRDYVNE